MGQLNILLCGAPRIEVGGNEVRFQRRKALALLAYLARSAQPQSRTTLAELLWPELDPNGARAALRSTLPTLTTLLPQQSLSVTRTSVALNRRMVRVDVDELIGALAQSRSHTHDTDALCAVCLPLFEGAAALYRGDFMAGFALHDSPEFDEWQSRQSEWLKREYGGIVRRLSHYYAERGAATAAQSLDYARRWLALDPLHEPAHRLLMQLYVANGQRSQALRQYHECVALLDAELATIPEEVTTQLFDSIKDQSFVATSAGSSNPVGILPPLPTLVVGRSATLRLLKGRLGIGGARRTVTVIQGWPGVGKSTTLAALAHDPEVAAAFPDGVLWASLGEAPNLLAEQLIWARALGIALHEHKLDDVSAQLTATLRDRRVLLLVDDVWQLQHAAPFKVGGQGCCLVYTTRLNDIAQALAPTPGDRQRLPLLSEADSLELLYTLAPTAVGDFPDEARQLVQDLEGLPLAIQVAGRLLNDEAQLGWGVADLLAELRAGARLLEAQAPGDVALVRQDTTPTVAALLRRSTDSLHEQVRERFALLGLFVPKPATFDLQAVAAAWDIDDPRPTVRLLVNRGLLEPVGGRRFQMHALLVLHARSLLE